MQIWFHQLMRSMTSPTSVSISPDPSKPTSTSWFRTQYSSATSSPPMPSPCPVVRRVKVYLCSPGSKTEEGEFGTVQPQINESWIQKAGFPFTNQVEPFPNNQRKTPPPPRASFFPLRPPLPRQADLWIVFVLVASDERQLWGVPIEMRSCREQLNWVEGRRRRKSRERGRGERRTFRCRPWKFEEGGV